MNLQTGAFGDPTNLKTLILFWTKMELLHYPGASDTKAFLEQEYQQQQEQMQRQMAMQEQIQQAQMVQETVSRARQDAQAAAQQRTNAPATAGAV